MKDFDETIFNLFILEYWMDYKFEQEKKPIMSQLWYDVYSNTPTFLALKDCFPENEVCSEDFFHSGNCTYYKTMNYIGEK
jgi:hypothetical protein